MKKVFKIAFLCIFISLFTVKTVNSAVLNSQTIINKVKKEVPLQINSIIKGKIVAEVVNIPFKKIDIPNGKTDISVTTDLKYFSHFTIAKVNILVNGQIVKTFGVPVKLYVFDKVWIAKNTINKGEELTYDNIVLENKEISLLNENTAGQNFNFSNIKSRKFYKQGEIIDTRFITETPPIVRNSIVSIIFENPDFSLTLSGEALEDGKMGDFIKVRNKQYKKEYIGKVVGINKILVVI